MLNFFIGAIVGGTVGVIVMSAFAVTGKSEASQRNEKKQTKDPTDSDS